MFLTEDVTDPILAPVCQEASVQTWIKQPDTFLDLLCNHRLSLLEHIVDVFVPVPVLLIPSSTCCLQWMGTLWGMV